MTLQPNTEAARQEVYAGGRNAVVQEFRTIEPPLAPGDTARREHELEDGSRRIEGALGAGDAASGASTGPVTARATDLDEDRTGGAARDDSVRSEPGLPWPEPRRSILPRVLLVALLALVLAGASYAAYTYRAGLQDLLASLTGSGSTDPSVAAADAGTAAEAPAPVGVAAVIPSESFLYEDVGTGTALAVEGTAEWAVLDDPDGTRIEITIDFPSRGLQVALAMQKAPDAAVDVSHTIDVMVTGPAADAVQSIAQLAGKTTEDAIGISIVARSSTVAPGHFRLELSTGSERQNLLQLRRDWFDLGLVYANGERALVTFNAGSQGQVAMQQALAAWED